MAKPKNLSILRHEQGGRTDSELLETTDNDVLTTWNMDLHRNGLPAYVKPRSWEVQIGR